MDAYEVLCGVLKSFRFDLSTGVTILNETEKISDPTFNTKKS